VKEMSDDLYKHGLRQRRGTAHHIRVREFGAPLEHSAYIFVDREKYTATRSRLGWRKKKNPRKNLETSDPHIAMPHKNELGLGQRIALA
jgi:hypothetical protein